MEIEAGDKQTEVGVIPDDWDVALLDRVAKRGSGHTPDKAHPEYWGGKIKWVSLQDSDRLDQLYISDTASKITPAGIANSSAKLHPRGTVVLSRDAGVGKSAIMKDDMAVSQHFIAWQCGPSLNNRFLYYWLQSKKAEFERIAMGNTIKTIGLPYFRQLSIPLPTRVEQEAIANVLSDADALIESLEQLIAKKRQLRQGTMQEVLTGNKRLPGFSRAWKVRSLRSCLLSDLDYGINAPGAPIDGNLPSYLRITDINDDGRLNSENRVAVNHPFSGKYLLRPNQIVFARTGASVGKSYLYDTADGELVFAGFLIRAKIDCSKLCPAFLAGYTRTRRYWSWVEMMSMRSGQPGINGREYANLELHLPPSIDEQSAIAAVLSDMGAEITALEQRRNKTRALKQGMMQELLTGKTRLV
jgi:type I restriction enzyme S subunit